MRKIFLGPPNAGKGTAASRVAPIRNIPHISTGDLFRENIKQQTEIGLKAKEYMDKGELVPDEIVIEMLKQRLEKEDCNKGFILDGFPRTAEQAQKLQEMTDIDMVVSLNVPDEILVERAATRIFCTKCNQGYNTRGIPTKQQGICDTCQAPVARRPDDEPETAKKRIQTYKEKTQPLIDYYKNLGILKEVQTQRLEETPEELVKNVLNAINVFDEELAKD